MPSKCSLQVWRMVIDNLTADDLSLDHWLGCEERVECEWAQELNSRQVLFECGHERYWYLEEEKEEENPPPSHASGSSSSFMETYPHFPTWQYEVMNLDGSYSSMALDRLDHTPNVPWGDPVRS
ncbi:hypothetical protein SO802_009944 [Lithocarpus litseifolius]|uniref:Uncharacterized protein n=1 Tax=Lithocarpus litseifolius TaxID=425828 RepID=A0AAW2DDE1_9ROSI